MNLAGPNVYPEKCGSDALPCEQANMGALVSAPAPTTAVAPSKAGAKVDPETGAATLAKTLHSIAA